MTPRMGREARIKDLLKVGLSLAEKNGYARITRDEVAHAAKCSPPLISIYFGSVAGFRTALMKEAIRARNLRVICQGLAARDPACLRLPPALKAEAKKAI